MAVFERESAERQKRIADYTGRRQAELPLLTKVRKTAIGRFVTNPLVVWLSILLLLWIFWRIRQPL